MKINPQASVRGAPAMSVVSFPHQAIVSSAGMEGIAVGFLARKSTKALRDHNLRASKKIGRAHV